MISKYIENERGKVYYWIRYGNRQKCIFLCHGLTADHNLFEKQMKYFPKEYTLIAWDMPLHGKSRPYKNFSFVNAAEDIKAILDKEEIKQIVIAGQSAGGYVSQKFFEMFPKRVKAFVGIDTTPLGKKYCSSLELFLIKHYSFLAGLYPYKLYCKESADAATYSKESYNSFYNTLVKLGKKRMKESSKAVYKELLKSKEVNLECPVILVIGEHDKVGSVKKYNDMWHKDKGYKLLTIKEASHNSNFDNYTRFNDIVYDFLKGNNM